MKYGAITVDQSSMHGKPVFPNTTVTVQTLFEYLEDGRPLEKFLKDYPGVNVNSAVEVIKMAKRTITTEKILKENFSE